jgi:hypothetical protein
MDGLVRWGGQWRGEGGLWVIVGEVLWMCRFLMTARITYYEIPETDEIEDLS